MQRRTTPLVVLGLGALGFCVYMVERPGSAAKEAAPVTVREEAEPEVRSTNDVAVGEKGDRQIIGTTAADFPDGGTSTITWYMPVRDFDLVDGLARERYELLKAQADAGSGGAAYALASMLRTCRRSFVEKADLDAAIDRLLQTHTIVDHITQEEMRIADPENLSNYVGFLTEDFEYCEGLTTDQRNEHAKWLEVSANNGDPIGMIEYGKQLNDPETSAEVFESAWRLGQGHALIHLAESYAQIYAQGNDPEANVRAYAAMLAYTNLLASARRSVATPDPELQARLDRLGSGLLPREQQAAIDLAKGMIVSNGNCCFRM